MTYVRFTEAYKLRARLMRRDTPYRIRIEEDFEHNPRDADCYSREDCQKFDSGEYRAWEYIIYRACPEHEGHTCEGAEIIASVCGIGVLDDADLEGDYTSPYFIANDYFRWLVWQEWPRKHEPLMWKRQRAGIHHGTSVYAGDVQVTAEFRPLLNPLRPWRLRDYRGTPCRDKPARIFETHHRTLRSAKRHADDSTWHLAS